MRDKTPPWVLAEFTIPQLVILANQGTIPKPRKSAKGEDEPWIRPDGSTAPPGP